MRHDGSGARTAFDPGLDRLALGPETKARWQDSVTNSMPPEQHAVMRQYLERTPYPDLLPADACCWRMIRIVSGLGAFPEPGATEAEWIVLDGAGTLVGLLEVPASMKLYAVRGDMALTGELRADDVELVRL